MINHTSFAGSLSAAGSQAAYVQPILQTYADLVGEYTRDAAFARWQAYQQQDLNDVSGDIVMTLTGLMQARALAMGVKPWVLWQLKTPRLF